MDLRGYLTGGEKEKGKDDSSQSKQPTEEGASAKPPPPKWKFQQSWKSDFSWVILQDGAMFCTWCVEKKSVQFLISVRHRWLF